jgi:hypothetical protein
MPEKFPVTNLTEILSKDWKTNVSTIQPTDSELLLIKKAYSSVRTSHLGLHCLFQGELLSFAFTLILLLLVHYSGNKMSCHNKMASL